VDDLRIDGIADERAELGREIRRARGERTEESRQRAEEARREARVRRIQRGGDLREARLVQLEWIAGEPEVGPSLGIGIVRAHDVPQRLIVTLPERIEGLSAGVVVDVAVRQEMDARIRR